MDKSTINKILDKKYNELSEEKSLLEYRIGLIRTIKNILKYFKKNKLRKELIKIKNDNRNKKVVIFPHTIKYYDIMRQRPQQIADELAKKKDIIYFFITNEEEESFVKNIKDNLYLISNQEILTEVFDHYTLHLYANSDYSYWNILEIMSALDSGNKVIYEYIDALDEGLLNVNQEILIRHDYLLSRDDVPIFCTAKVLYDEVVNKYRKKNVFLTSNGVKYDDFNNDKKKIIPLKIKKVIKSNNKIITYYGAIAKWLDYELIKKIAQHNKNYHIIMIGKNYYHEEKTLDSFENIHFIGPVEYKELINYGYASDVFIIPFLINDITKATSPVKVFEYMAMEKPIVITDLPECRKYKSINIAKNHKEFINMLDKVLNNKLNNQERKLMKKEALENTWENKALEIYEEI